MTWAGLVWAGPAPIIKKKHAQEPAAERFAFLKWGATAFEGLTIVPPGNGIVHQVNIEYLARCLMRVSEWAHMWVGEWADERVW